MFDRLVDHVYPLADDPGGNLLCFDYRRDKDNPTIVYWDHEAALLDAEKGLNPVCDTFTELLHKLYETQYGHEKEEEISSPLLVRLAESNA